jgi:hypothetical protein
MALQHLRASTADKRPTPAAMADGQLALNTNLASPGLFFKDSNGDLVKVGPVHVGTTAPNATPASGGQAGNSKGEQWLDTSSSRYVFKIWDGTDWRTEDGEFVNASGDTMTGALVMDNQQQIRFRETTANGTNFIALQAPASVSSDKTITLPDVTGTVVTTGDTGSVTSTMLLDGTILNADINASAAIVDTKLDTIATAGKVSNSATTATNANTASAIVARDASGNFSAGTITAALTGAASANVLKAGDTMTGPLSVPLGSASAPSIYPGTDTNTGIYSPGADQVAISTNGTGRLFVDANGNVGLNRTPTNSAGYTTLDMIGASGSQILLNRTGSLDAFFFTTNGLAGLGAGSGSGLAFYTNSSGSTNERMRLTSTGLLGLGTSSPSDRLSVVAPADTAAYINVQAGGSATVLREAGVYLNASKVTGGSGTSSIKATGDPDGSNGSTLILSTESSSNSLTERVRIDSSGRVGIGTTSPNESLEVAGNIHVSGADRSIFNRSNNALTFGTNNAERARIDSSGRLLVGTSSSVGDYQLQLQRNAGSAPYAGSILLRRGIANGSILTNYDLGVIGAGSTTDVGGSIRFQSDGTWGSDDYPTRLVFSVTADGSASPTEALRISSNRAITVSDGGNVVLGTTTGTKIGTATSQKIGFYNATPVVQPTTGVAEAAFVENSGGTAVNVDSTFGGYTIQQVVEALQTLGLLA